jgi:hypothetical protein
MPTISTRNIIEQAAQDPQFMALLLQRGRTDAERIKIARSLHSYMGAAGLNYANFEEPPVQPQATTPGLAASQLRQLPSAPSTRGVPGFGKQPGPGSAPQGPASSAAPAGGTSRSMFQSLFPFDTISPMVGGQPPKQ